MTASFYSGSRFSIEKTSGSGTTIFLDFSQFSKPIFGRLAFLSQMPVAIEIRSGSADFLNTFFIKISIVFSRKGLRTTIFVERKSAESLEDHPGRKGTALKENPGPQPLPGKTRDFYDAHQFERGNTTFP